MIKEEKAGNVGGKARFFMDFKALWYPGVYWRINTSKQSFPTPRHRDRVYELINRVHLLNNAVYASNATYDIPKSCHIIYTYNLGTRDHVQ